MPFTVTEWLPVLAALGALITSIITASKFRSEVRKNEADASESVSDAALSLLEPYKAEVQSLREEMRVNREAIQANTEKLKRVEEELYIYKEGTKILVAQLTQNGIRPLWKPPDWLG